MKRVAVVLALSATFFSAAVRREHVALILRLVMAKETASACRLLYNG